MRRGIQHSRPSFYGFDRLSSYFSPRNALAIFLHRCNSIVINLRGLYLSRAHSSSAQTISTRRDNAAVVAARLLHPLPKVPIPVRICPFVKLLYVHTFTSIRETTRFSNGLIRCVAGNSKPPGFLLQWQRERERERERERQRERER